MSLTDAGVLLCDAIIALAVILFIGALLYGIVDFVLEVWFTEEEEDDPLPPIPEYREWVLIRGRRNGCSQMMSSLPPKPWPTMVLPESFRIVPRPPYDWAKEEQHDGAVSG